MQPNQLPSNDPMPYQVPDYLQMGPAPGVPPSRSRKGLFIIGAVIALIVIGVAAALFVLSQSLTPEERFYAALKNSLQTSYVHKEVKIERTNPSLTTSISADSDFSNPDTPKSSLVYTYDGPKDAKDVTKTRLLAGQIVTIDSTHYAGKIMTAAASLSPYGLKLNEWSTGVRGKAWSAGNPDILGLYTDGNNSAGSFLVGDFSARGPDAIIELLRANNVYVIQSSGEKKVGDTTYTSYTIKEDYQKLSSLIGKLNADYGMKLVPSAITTTNISTVTISNETGMITEAVEDIKQGEFQARVQTAFSYPDNVMIKIPDGVKSTD